MSCFGLRVTRRELEFLTELANHSKLRTAQVLAFYGWAETGGGRAPAREHPPPQRVHTRNGGGGPATRGPLHAAVRGVQRRERARRASQQQPIRQSA